MDPIIERTQDAPRRQDDDLELADIVAMLWRNRWILLGTLLVSTLAGIVYLILATPLYESNAVIKIGVASERKEPIEQPSDVIARLKLEHSLSFGKPQATGESRVKSVSPFESASYIRIVAEGFTPRAAKDEAHAAATKIIDEHAERQAKVITHMETHLKRLDALHTILSDHRSQTSEGLNANLASTGSPALAAIVALEGASVEDRLVTVQEAILERELALELIRDNPTRFHYEPRADPDPVYPLRLITLGLCVLLGMTMGIIMALTREFWVRNRERFQS